MLLKKKYQKVKLLSGSSCHAEKRVSILMKRLIFITKEKAAGCCCNTIWQERQHLKPEDSLNPSLYLLAFYPSVVNGTLSSLIKMGPKGLRSQESRFGSLHLIKNCIHSKWLHRVKGTINGCWKTAGTEAGLLKPGFILIVPFSPPMLWNGGG